MKDKQKNASLAHIPRIINTKIRFPCQNVYPVARSLTDRQTECLLRAPFQGFSFFPSTYHQGSAQVRGFANQSGLSFVYGKCAQPVAQWCITHPSSNHIPIVCIINEAGRASINDGVAKTSCVCLSVGCVIQWSTHTGVHVNTRHWQAGYHRGDVSGGMQVINPPLRMSTQVRR